MALPINIEELLNKQKVVSDRIEFKKGWNSVSIYHSICAFANDIDNIGGGYILVGVEEKNGIAQRPVIGLETDKLDKIQREILQYNQLIEPFYAPRLSVEKVDGKKILVLWVTSGHNRPYTVPADVNAKLKKPVFYIRYGTSSIEAKGEQLDELREMANRVPFDDRGNDKIRFDDISPLLLQDYLTTVESKLAQEDLSNHLADVLEQMELNSTEGRATGIPTIQRKLEQNGSPRATIDTDEDRTYFLIDIPCHPDLVYENFQDVKDDVKGESVDIEIVIERLSKVCPSHVQVMSKSDVERLVMCMMRCTTAISAQGMLEGIEQMSYKQLRRKYLQQLLEMELITMTIPDKPRSQNQKYVLTEKGKEILR